jgi:hypothetical protein
VNLLGHVRVALRTTSDDEHLLGAVLPDLESLLGQRLESARSRPGIAAGIAVHRATDAAFHADLRFTTGSIALTRALLARGVGRGPSRAVGHAGWELLLDGLLVDDPEVTAGFARAIAVLAEVARDEPAATDRLEWFARRQGDQPIWAAYADPAMVADRLHRQLSTRPRLSFPTEQRTTVAEELAGAVRGIRADGPGLIEDVTRIVTAPR